MMASKNTVLRVRRPRWRDPRLLIGILLVTVSVLAGALLAARLAQTTTVYSLRTDMVPGDVITREDLVAVDVRLGDAAPLYVTDAAQIPDGATAAVPLRAGELLSSAAIAQPGDVALRPVTIPVDGAAATTIEAGHRVEVWRTHLTGSARGQDGTAEAQLLYSGAIVRSVESGTGLAMTGTTVEILVPQEELPEILEAVAEQDRIDVIEMPGALEVG